MAIENKQFLENVFKSITLESLKKKKSKNFQDRDENGGSIGYSYTLKVENYCGYKVEIEFYGGGFPEEKESDKVQDLDVTIDSLTKNEVNLKMLRDYSMVVLEKPYILSVSLAERVGVQQADNPLRMNLRLIDDHGNTFYVSGIDAENQLTNRCVLESEQDGMQTKTVYIHLKTQDHYKSICLYSKITIKNQLERSIWVNNLNFKNNF